MTDPFNRKVGTIKISANLIAPKQFTSDKFRMKWLQPILKYKQPMERFQ